MACPTCIRGITNKGKVCTDCNGGGACKVQDPLGVLDRVNVIKVETAFTSSRKGR